MNSGASVPRTRWFLLVTVFIAALLAAAAVAGTSGVPLRTLYVLEGLSREDPRTGLLRFLAKPVQSSRIQATTPAEVDLDIYKPVSQSGKLPAVLLMPGFNRLGLDDPYMVGLAHLLAGLGMVVMIPDLDELFRFQWSERVADGIAFAVDRLLSLPDVDADRVGVIGLSISGGFGLAAVARTEAASRLSYAVVFAPFHDYERLLRFAATGCVGPPAPNGPPCAEVNPFARGIFLYNFLHHALPPSHPDYERAREVLLTRLRDRTEPSAEQLSAMSPSSRDLLRGLESGSNTILESMAARAIADSAPLSQRLSPHRSLCNLRGTLFVIHGTDDRVVPVSEAQHLHQQCQACGSLSCQTMMTPLYRHGHVLTRSLRKLPEHKRLYAFFSQMVQVMFDGRKLPVTSEPSPPR